MPREKGKKLYNNGTETKSFRIGEQPKGWVLGRHTKPWNKGLTKETDERILKSIEKSIPKRKGRTPWNKGKKGVQEAWNKSLTKETDERVRIYYSENRMGEKNPHQFTTPEQNEKRSKGVKTAILEGRFTPNSNNRNTHWESEFDGIKFRSSWEAVFYYFNKNLLYEDLRIPYLDENGVERIYITDFVDYENRKVYEIKPSNLAEKQRNKINEAIKWCKENNMEFILITEDYINRLKNKIEISDYNRFDKETIRKLGL